MYTCSKCNKKVIVEGASVKKACSCKIKKRRRTLVEIIRILLGLYVEDVWGDAPVIASLSAEVFNHSKMNG